MKHGKFNEFRLEVETREVFRDGFASIVESHTSMKHHHQFNIFDGNCQKDDGASIVLVRRLLEAKISRDL